MVWDGEPVKVGKLGRDCLMASAKKERHFRQELGKITESAMKSLESGG